MYKTRSFCFFWIHGVDRQTPYYKRFIDPEDDNAPTCTLKIIPPKCTPICQPCDVYFFRQVKNFLKRLQNAQELIAAKKEISDRKDIIKLHSLIHNQLSAPIFRAMIKYAWFASKLTPPTYKKRSTVLSFP